MTGNFRMWGPTQFKQYHALLGYLKLLGVEIEQHRAQSDEMRNREFDFFNGLPVQRNNEVPIIGKPVRGPESYANYGELEFNVLHDVSNPIQLHKQLSWVDEVAAYGLALDGSIHFNSVHRITRAIHNNRELRVCSDYIGHSKDRKEKRIESKKGQASQCKAEYVRQFLLYGGLIKGVSKQILREYDQQMLEYMRPEDQLFALSHSDRDGLIFI